MKKVFSFFFFFPSFFGASRCSSSRQCRNRVFLSETTFFFFLILQPSELNDFFLVNNIVRTRGHLIFDRLLTSSRQERDSRKVDSWQEAGKNCRLVRQIERTGRRAGWEASDGDGLHQSCCCLHYIPASHNCFFTIYV